MKVSFTSDQDTEIDSLYDWLSSDPDLARSVRVAAPTGTDREAMGAVDTVAAVASSVIGLGQLAFAFAGWRQDTSTGATLTITRPDGHRLTITGAQAVTGEAISQFLSAGGDGSGRAGRRPKR